MITSVLGRVDEERDSLGADDVEDRELCFLCDAIALRIEGAGEIESRRMTRWLA